MVIAAGTAVAWPAIQKWIDSNPEEFPEFITENVKLAPFRITVTERGTLDSLKNATLKNTVEGSTTIISIVTEGSQVQAPVQSKVDGVVEKVDESLIIVRNANDELVEHVVTPGEFTTALVEPGDEVKAGENLAGDLVCELDSSMLTDKEKQQQILVTQSEADLKKGEENVAIQKTQNESDIAAGKLAVELAALDLEKFEKGESIQTENEIKSEITLAEETLTQARENYEFNNRIAKKGYKTLNEVETLRIAAKDAELKLAIAKEKLDVHKKYTYKRTIKELTENAAESGRELKRVERSGIAALTQFQAELKARQLTFEVETGKLADLRRQIKACRLIAPANGKVVYASQQSRRSEPIVIEEGAAVRERQTIIKLPDFTQMKVDARIHESKISQIQVGLSVRIRVDAFPETIFNGVMDSVSDVPVAGSWPNMDLKEYEAAIRITDSIEKIQELKPGLTAGLEIIVDEGGDGNVLQIPVQGVVSAGGEYSVFVLTPKGPERRTVEIGRTNDTAIELTKGVEVGEKVILNPRTHFSSEIEDLETAAAKKKKENDSASASATAPKAKPQVKKKSGKAPG